MKYMGSKRWMLGNGLGKLLDSTAPRAKRFVDLFSGSSAVAAFVATRHRVPVVSADLQTYSRVLSAAVIERTAVLDGDAIWKTWESAATAQLGKIRTAPVVKAVTRSSVSNAREWCARRKGLAITSAYGGHYFSPKQALWLDALRATLPNTPAEATVALAALIEAAAYCAAAPGHTAQPFQPTRSARAFLIEAWNRDVATRTNATLQKLCSQHAKIAGSAVVADAVEFAKTLQHGDLVFIDPPYSGVHYSRFYHVLETLAHGTCNRVTGVGRYPDNALRPKSDFSIVSKSRNAFERLLAEVANRNAEAIVTFPAHRCSNGISGKTIARMAARHFHVKQKSVSSKFSTLGGTSGASSSGSDRAARQSAKELILYLRPKSPTSPATERSKRL